MTSQAPHLIRTVFALVAGLPEEKIRIISPDIGGGFGNKVPVYPGYVVATAASLLLGKPVKWIEERSENLISTGFARDLPHARRDGVEVRRHDAGAQSVAPGGRGRVLRRRPAVEVQGRAVPHRERLLRPPGRARLRRGRLHEQSARWRRVPVLVPRHRGLVPDRAPGAERRIRARHGPGRAPQEELHPAGAVPVPLGDGVRVRLGRLRDGDEHRVGQDRLRRSAQGAGDATRRRASSGAWGWPRSPRSSAPGRTRTTTSSASR